MERAIIGNVNYNQDWTTTADVSYIELNIAGDMKVKLIIPEDHIIKLTINPVSNEE